MRCALVLLALPLAVVGCGGGGGHGSAATAPRGSTTRATLDVESGATSITVRAAAIGDDLYRVSTPRGAGVAASVVHDGNRVQVFTHGKGAGPAALVVAVSPSVRWRVRVNGGASDLVVDFGAGKLASASVAAGDARATFTLSRPTGDVPIGLSGGASELDVHAPPGVPVRVSIDGGASSLILDGIHRTGIAAGTVVTPPGWTSATARYDLVAHAGVSAITVDRR
ncbi:MAG TPA: hypothetical protein VFA30_08900 [Gaiellaceae bacterium]|nr:hypothetical protein [Gaiellaceae bacterium]